MRPSTRRTPRPRRPNAWLREVAFEVLGMRRLVDTSVMTTSEAENRLDEMLLAEREGDTA